MGSKIVDITGKIYGQLTVLSIDTMRSSRVKYWICKCNCGNTKSIVGYSLKRGSTKSCGCTQGNRHGETIGGVHTKEYMAWARTKAKCQVKSHHAYKWYGGRGISMCKRWLDSYENFLSDMGRAPSKKHSLGRIDNDGNYEPSNCRWETHIQQVNNTRANRRIEYQNEIKTIAEWSRHLGMSYGLIRDRISKNWPLDKVFSSHKF